MRAPAKIRIDALLVQRGLVETREKARALIMAGQVDVDGHGGMDARNATVAIYPMAAPP